MSTSTAARSPITDRGADRVAADHGRQRTHQPTHPNTDQPIPSAGNAGPTPGQGRAARVLAAAWRLVTRLVLVVAALTFLLIALGPHLFGYRTATMLTGSMSPYINPGDVIVSVAQRASEVTVGDVITYHIPVDDHRVETHRIVKVTTDADGRLAIVTKGDANAGADPWVATLEGDTVWETRAVVPHAGTVIRSLREPLFQTYVLRGVLALMVVVGLRRIWGGTPALDGDVLPGLADELGSTEAAAAFATTFRDLIDTRVARIAHAVEDGNATVAIEAALSLEVTSATVGAVRLAAGAAALTEAVERGNHRAAGRAVRRLRRAAPATARALDASSDRTRRG